MGLFALAAAFGLTASAEAARLGSAELFFSYDGDRAGTCVTVNEPADQAAWEDNVLCGSALPPGTRWSYDGPIPGLRCTQVLEPADPSTWDDNYLCVPVSAPIGFVWSHRGLPRLDRRAVCAPWQEPSDPDTWNDNVLCAVPLTRFEQGLLGSVVPPAGAQDQRLLEMRNALEQERARRLDLEHRLEELRIEAERVSPSPDIRMDGPRNVIVPR
jgi:hypothetical protein